MSTSWRTNQIIFGSSSCERFIDTSLITLELPEFSSRVSTGETGVGNKGDSWNCPLCLVVNDAAGWFLQSNAGNESFVSLYLINQFHAFKLAKQRMAQMTRGEWARWIFRDVNWCRRGSSKYLRYFLFFFSQIYSRVFTN